MFPVDDLEFKINATFLAYCKSLTRSIWKLRHNFSYLTLTALKNTVFSKNNLKGKGKRKPWMLSFAKEVFLILFLGSCTKQLMMQQVRAASGSWCWVCGSLLLPGERDTSAGDVTKISTWEITLKNLYLLKQELWESVLCDLASKHSHLYLH